MQKYIFRQGGCLAWLSNLYILTLSLSLSTNLPLPPLSLSKFFSIQFKASSPRFYSVADLFYCFSETPYLSFFLSSFFFSENVLGLWRWEIETQGGEVDELKIFLFLFLFWEIQRKSRIDGNIFHLGLCFFCRIPRGMGFKGLMEPYFIWKSWRFLFIFSFWVFGRRGGDVAESNGWSLWKVVPLRPYILSHWLEIPLWGSEL